MSRQINSPGCLCVCSSPAPHISRLCIINASKRHTDAYTWIFIDNWKHVFSPWNPLNQNILNDRFVYVCRRLSLHSVCCICFFFSFVPNFNWSCVNMMMTMMMLHISTSLPHVKYTHPAHFSSVSACVCIHWKIKISTLVFCNRATLRCILLLFHIPKISLSCSSRYY